MKMMRVYVEYSTDNDRWGEYSTGMQYNVSPADLLKQVEGILNSEDSI